MRDERQVFELRLRDQQPVERISVMRRQLRRDEGVPHLDRQRAEGALLDPRGDIAGRCEPAGGTLDRDLPRAGRADEHGVHGIGYRVSRSRAETVVVSEPPQERVRVEKQPHDPPGAISSNPGGSSSKSERRRGGGRDLLRPRPAPGRGEGAAVADIDVINERFALNLTEADQLLFDQLEAAWASDERLAATAEANSFENFRLVFDREFVGSVVGRMEENEELVRRVLDEPDFKRVVEEYYAGRLYERLQGETGDADSFLEPA